MLTKKELTPIAQKLSEARELLAKPGKWVKYTLVKNRKGIEIPNDYNSNAFAFLRVYPDKVCNFGFCALGALRFININNVIPYDYDLEAALGASVPEQQSVAFFNDAKTTRKSDILALFDRAIRRAKRLKL